MNKSQVPSMFRSTVNFTPTTDLSKSKQNFREIAMTIRNRERARCTASQAQNVPSILRFAGL
jgi:hypothetical protein